MKLFIVSVLIAVVAADRLENTYLPPNSAKTAGGNGNFLNAPFGQGGNGVSNKYGAPSGPSAPSGNYGAPSNNFNQQQQFRGGAQGGHGGNGGNGGQQPGPDAGAAILKFENENNGDGSYRFEYETENQIQHQESGELKNQGTEQEAQSVQGSYSYMGPDGVLYTVTYTADENGFQATGDHIPTAPPIPEAILKSLEQNAAEESSGYGNVNGGYQGGNGNGNGYQSSGNGYQQSGNGYQQNGNGNAGYQQNGRGNGGYQQNGNGNGNGYQNGQNKYQGASTSGASRQYIPPNKSNGNGQNGQNGYQY